MTFYHNIIKTFNEHVDYDSDYELDDATTTWLKETLRWWQMYVYHIYVCTTNAISGMYPDYKEVALMSAVKKEMTPMRKKVTLPSF